MAIAVTVDETTATGQLGNRASVATDTVDASALDDTAAELTTITRQADLAVAKVATPNPSSSGNAVAGGQISYLVTVDNLGPSSASNVSLSGLPACWHILRQCDPERQRQLHQPGGRKM